MSKQLLSILVNNRPGVLYRVSGMFMRRGYNIDDLTVSTTELSSTSRITALVEADEAMLRQVIAQLDKLEDVQRVQLMDGGTRREIALAKIKLQGNGAQLMDTLTRHRAKVADMGESTITAEIVGDSCHIDDFITDIVPFGLMEIVRSGIVALERGDGMLRSMSAEGGVCVK